MKNGLVVLPLAVLRLSKTKRYITRQGSRSSLLAESGRVFFFVALGQVVARVFFVSPRCLLTASVISASTVCALRLRVCRLLLLRENVICFSALAL